MSMPERVDMRERLRAAKVPVEVLDADPGTGAATLRLLRVPARSALGAFVLHTGGAFVDGGLLQVYGSPASGAGARLRSLAQVNGLGNDDWAEPGLVVAHDARGGVFMIRRRGAAADGTAENRTPSDGTAAEATEVPGRPGEMLHFGLGSLRWAPLGIGYGAWLTRMLAGGVNEFYEGLGRRSPGVT